MENLKSESFKSIYKRLAALVIFAGLIFIFVQIWFVRLNVLRQEQFLGKGNLLVVTVYAVVLFLVLYNIGGFKVGYSKAINLILSQTVSLVIVNVLAWAQVLLIIGHIHYMKQIVTAILLLTAAEFLWCLVFSNLLTRLYHRLFPPYRMLMVSGYYNNTLSQKMSARDEKYQICEEISVEQGLDKVFQKISEYDVILVNDIPNEEMKHILKYCYEHTVRVYFTPKITDILIKGADEVDLFDSPLLLCKNIGLNFEQRFVKRCMDILVSLLGILIMSPVMLVIAIAIKAHDGGKVFFYQERCTRSGKKFMMCKFRSMIENAEEDGKSRPAVNDDERITPIGHIIRNTRLDELPQLFNILKGEMSLVGPRPERVEHVEKYTEEIPEFSYRMKVKGGLTGYAQVYGKYNTTAYDKLKMDLKYIVDYSLLLDLRILLMTLKVIFMKESTEGFEQKPAEKDGE